MRLPKTAAALLAIAVVAGCASPRSLVPNESTIVETRAKLGTPTDIRFDRNGDELWEYATGPAGTETYLVRFGADGRVKEVTQLLNEHRLMSIVPGTATKTEVRQLLGRPSDESFYGAGTVWSWRFKRDGSQPGYLTVTFNPDGTVKERIAIIDPSGDRDRSVPTTK